MNKIILGIIAFIAIAVGLIVAISDLTAYQTPPSVQQVDIHPTAPNVAPVPTQAPATDDWGSVGDTTKPPLIPPVGPAWVTSVGTGGIGVIA